MVTQRAPWPFVWTLAVFGIAAGWCWFQHEWVLECWIAGLVQATGPGWGDQWFWEPNHGLLRLEVATLTAGLVAFPVFQVEAWRLLCRVARADRALRLTLPFVACATGAELLAVALTFKSLDWLVFFT
jgi:hypothetical protein